MCRMQVAVTKTYFVKNIVRYFTLHRILFSTYIVRRILYDGLVRRLLYDGHCMPYYVLLYKMYDIYCMRFTVRRTVNVHVQYECTVYSVQCTVYIVHGCTLYIVQCTTVYMHTCVNMYYWLVKTNINMNKSLTFILLWMKNSEINYAIIAI